MKKFLSIALLFAFVQSSFFFVLAPAASASARTRQQETLTNQSVIDMAQLGISADVIVAKIKGSKASFDTSAAALQNLKKAGVADAVIMAMVQKASGMEISAPATTTTNSGGAVQSSGGAAMSVAIPDGTEIKIMTVEEISGQKVVEGDQLNFKVSEDLKINGRTVIAKDTLVKGTVATAKKKGFMGKGGELSVRIESTQTVDNQKIKLRASKSGAGGDNMGSTVALTVLFGPLGLLRRGKEAKIKAGTVLTAYVDEPKTVMAN